MMLFSQADKQAHAMGCAVIFAALYFALLPLGMWIAGSVAGAVIVVLSWWKEAVYDATHPGHQKDWWDARAGVIGGLAMALWMMGAAPLLHYLLLPLARH